MDYVIKNKFVFAWFLISTLALMFSLLRLYNYEKLEERGVRVEAEVINKSCMRRSGSSITLNYSGNEFVVQYDRKSCYALEIGTNIQVVYDGKKGLIYILGSIWRYRRHCYGALFSLILSLLPWHKFKE